MLELSLKDKWQNVVLKPGLKEGTDFMLVDEFLWNYLKSRYNCKKDEEIKRLGIIVNDETEEGVVELYLRNITIYPVPNSIMVPLKFDVPKTIIISRRETIAELEKKVGRVLNTRLFER